MTNPPEYVDLGPTSDDWVAALASPDVYQAAVRRLTAELRECRTQQAADRREHKAEADALRAQLHEGLTPEILHLRSDVSRWRSRAHAAELRLREARRSGSTR